MTKFYFFVFVLVAITSCKTASKAYDKGDYRDAVELAIKKLQKDPTDGETKALLQAAYKNVVTVSESKIRTLSNSASYPYEAIYNEYRRLQSLYESVQPYPSLASLVHAQDYSGYVKTYGEKAAEAHVEKGLDAMERGDKLAYRTAYREFKTALRFADNRDTRLQMEKAYQAAVINIVVLPMNSYGGYQYNASYQLRNFEDDLLRNVRYGINNEFIQLYSEGEARVKNIIPDQVLRLQLGRFDFGRPYDQTSTRTVTKDVVVKETVYKPDSVVKQYAKVTAQIITTRRTMVSQGEVYMTFLDTDGRTLWNDRLNGEHQWQTEFTSFRGDERALSEGDKSGLNKALNNAPSEDEIIEQLLRQIESDMRYRLRNYFSRFD
ncbi:MAG: hypothetical protein JWP88_70 [Flaviaesturariibacter sp.]|nr:hypothetical protein [Flaviaesturariibacter sp.]